MMFNLNQAFAKTVGAQSWNSKRIGHKLVKSWKRISFALDDLQEE